VDTDHCVFPTHGITAGIAAQSVKKEKKLHRRRTMMRRSLEKRLQRRASTIHQTRSFGNQALCANELTSHAICRNERA